LGITISDTRVRRVLRTYFFGVLKDCESGLEKYEDIIYHADGHNEVRISLRAAGHLALQWKSHNERSYGI